jgi:hypothetical protein
MVRKKIWMAVFTACAVFLSFSHEASAQWAKTFSTGTDDLIGVMGPSTSSSGNYGLYGQIITETTEKALVSRHDSSGKFQWGKVISAGGKESLVVREMDDGGFLVTGTKDLSATSTPAKNIIWARYNSSWATVYSPKMFGGSRDEDAVYSELSKDGGFFGIGETNSYSSSAGDYDILIGKINSSGSLKWAKAIHNGMDDRGVDMVELSAGGYIALAEVASTTGKDILVFKLDADGNIGWKNLFSKSGYNYADALYLMKNGDILVMGTTESATGIDNLFLIRLNSSGTFLWQKTYGNTDDDVAVYNLIENSDGTLILCGAVSRFNMTPPFSFISKILLMKLSSAGVIQLQKTLTDGNINQAAQLIETSGQLLLSGSSMAISATAMDADILYGKINPSTLSPVWMKKFGAAGNEFGAVMSTGSSYFLSGMTDSYPVGGPMKTFGITLDDAGSYSGCTPIKNVTLTSGTAGLSAPKGTFESSKPNLTIRSPGPAQPTNTTLTITEKTLTEATLCSGGTTKPAAPTNLKATSTSASNVNLTWTASSGATSYKVFRKTPSTNWTLINTATTTSYTDTLANGNKTTVSFSYYVQACNSAGCSTATKTAIVPFAPTAFTATAGAGKVELKWTDKSDNETGFEIYRKPGACSAGGTWTKIATTAANVKAFTNTGLDKGKTYSYKIRAYKRSASPYAYGYSAYTTCANATVK